MTNCVAAIQAPRLRYQFSCMRLDDEAWPAYEKLVRQRAALRHPNARQRAAYDAKIAALPRHEVWSEDILNLVTTVGKTDLIDKYFKGSAYTAAWYLGLKGTGSAAVGDTLASHAGWAEVNPYSGNRPAITFGTTSGGSNTASAVGYSITGSATVAGAFVASVNTGTSGTLYSAGDFAASRSVISGDTLNVTLTVSAT